MGWLSAGFAPRAVGSHGRPQREGGKDRQRSVKTLTAAYHGTVGLRGLRAEGGAGNAKRPLFPLPSPVQGCL